MSDAYITVCSTRGKYSALRVLWVADEAIAREVCSDPRTSGRQAFLNWTSVHGQKVRWLQDDGRFAGVLADLGLQVVEDGDIPRLVRRESGESGRQTEVA